MHTSSNGHLGILAHGSVAGNTAFANGADGIEGVFGIVTGNLAIRNGHGGLVLGGDIGIGNTAASNGRYGFFCNDVVC